MDHDIRQFVGFIVMGLAAATVLLSYVGAFLAGRGHGRRDAERELRAGEREQLRAEDGPRAQGERLRALELHVEGIARALERLTDAQRLLAAQQDRRASRAAAEAAALRLGAPRGTEHNTPA